MEEYNPIRKRTTSINLTTGRILDFQPQVCQYGEVQVALHRSTSLNKDDVHKDREEQYKEVKSKVLTKP